MNYHLLLSLIPAVQAVLVIETVYQTAYVTVTGNGTLFNSTNLNSTNSTTSEAISSVPISSVVVTTSPEDPYIASTSSIPEPVSVAPETSATPEYVAPVETSSEVIQPIETVVHNVEVSSVQAVVSSEAPAATTSEAVVVVSSVAPAQTSAASTPASGSLESVAVSYHNQVRAQHGAGAVTWSDTLASYAANYLANSGCNFAHSGGDYGENIAWGYSTYQLAMQAWYDEYKLYDYNNPGYSSAVGHFTQMVWKGTTQIGCAAIDCSGATYLACEYNPAGNYIGQFAENVS